MLAKFLAVEEATSIAPHSTAEVKIQDSDLSNVWFMFPTTEFAARGLILANAGLLLWPAKAFVYNSKDVTQNIAKGECIAINVKLEEEGLKMGEIQAPVESEPVEEPENAEASEAASEETNESSEDAPVNPDEITDPMEGENADADEVASTETNESSEEKEEEEETPKKSSRSKK